MPKCTIDGCDSRTPNARGVAAAEGWRCFDMQGPGGNKYGNICPKHDKKEVLQAVKDAGDKIAEKRP